MATTTTTSKRWTLNVRDLLRGLLLSVISGVLTALLPLLQEPDFIFKWKTIGIVAATTGISYLLKNWISPGEIVINNPGAGQIDAIKKGTAEVLVQTTGE